MELCFADRSARDARDLDFPEAGELADEGDVDIEIVFVELGGVGGGALESDELDHGRPQ
jgi:hypothetical protein